MAVAKGVSSRAVARRFAPARRSAVAFTVEEFADHIGISRNLAYEVVRTGKIRVVRIGKRILIPTSAVDRLLAGTE